MKKQYTYTKCSQCGKEKSPSSKSICYPCIKEKNYRKRYTYKRCNICKVEKNESTNPYCKSCYNERYAQKRRIVNLTEMTKFVRKVEKNNYDVTLKEMFVDIIGFYNELPADKKIDNYSVNVQIKKMFDTIKEYVDSPNLQKRYTNI